MSARADEVQDKLGAMRRWLAQACAGALRLRGVDWFAWATAGGSATVLQSAETGVAELLVTPDTALVLADEIDAERLREEQVPEGYAFFITPWADPALREHFVIDAARGAPVLSDRPAGLEQPLPPAARVARMVLAAPEQ